MTPIDFLDVVVRPTLQWLGGGGISSAQAELQLLCTAMQESELLTRIQEPHGPAHGFYQMEPEFVADFVRRGTGLCHRAIQQLDFSLDGSTLYDAIRRGADHVATIIARDAYLRVPEALPLLHDEQGAWAQYDGTWKPGAPDRARWHRIYPVCLSLVADVPPPSTVPA